MAASPVDLSPAMEASPEAEAEAPRLEMSECTAESHKASTAKHKARGKTARHPADLEAAPAPMLSLILWPLRLHQPPPIASPSNHRNPAPNSNRRKPRTSPSVVIRCQLLPPLTDHRRIARCQPAPLDQRPERNSSHSLLRDLPRHSQAPHNRRRRRRRL